MSTVDFEKLKKRKESGGRQNDGTWKPKAGPNRIFILPPHSSFLTQAVEYFALEYSAHFFNVEGQQQANKTRCLGELKQKCPACSTSFAYKDSEDPGFKQLATKVRRASQYLFNIIDLNNLQAGIQVWRANYTCWNGIMEIGCNPSWGNIVDPPGGVVFNNTQLLAGQTKTGRNSYSVVPDPQRISVMPLLEAAPDWQAKLDALESYILPPATADEIKGWLEEMGFPSSSGALTRAPVPSVVSVGGPASAPVASVVPVSITPVGVTVPTAAPAAPTVISTAPAPLIVPIAPVGVEQPRPNQAPVTTTLKTGAVTVHYDPGPSYQPKFSDAERPDNAPRCFGDYNSSVHRCQPCPMLTDCQMKMLGAL